MIATRGGESRRNMRLSVRFHHGGGGTGRLPAWPWSHLIATRGGESRRNRRLPVRFHHGVGGTGSLPAWPWSRGGGDGLLVGIAIAGDR